MSRLRLLLSCFVVLLALAAMATSAGAASFTYRGQLHDAGDPAQGDFSLQLAVYAHADSTVPLFGPLTIERVPVTDGMFEVPVEIDPLPGTLSRAWLSVAVKPAASAQPFQMLGDRSEVDLRGGVCPMSWALAGNAGTGESHGIGTTDGQALRLIANGAAALRIIPNPLVGNTDGPSLIGGHVDNTATGRGAAIAGGGRQGTPNRVTGAFGAIGGGYDNDAAVEAAVGGGRLNSAAGHNSVVGGGFGNAANGDYSTIAGGDGNVASGPRASVGGGQSNIAAGTNASVVGGNANAAVRTNSAVGNGHGNCAGGSNSWAGGSDAKIRLGSQSPAIGACAGVQATGALDGDRNTFMWADSQGNLLSTGPNQFMVRASGGFWFGSSGTAPPIPAGRLIQTSTGAHLTSGGAWTNSSSRALKQAFAAVDPISILDALVDLPIATWRYSASPTEGRHLGPTAEDFAERFGLGAGGDSISTVDASGVALAAIQGLNAKLESENSQLRTENTRLRDDFEALRARVDTLLAQGTQGVDEAGSAQ